MCILRLGCISTFGVFFLKNHAFHLPVFSFLSQQYWWISNIYLIFLVLDIYQIKEVVLFFLLHRMWSSADYDGLSQQYWSTIHNGLKYTIHQKKEKQILHYKTTFVWTIIIGLNSVFPLFSALPLNYKCVFFSFVKARFIYYWFKMLTKV